MKQNMGDTEGKVSRGRRRKWRPAAASGGSKRKPRSHPGRSPRGLSFGHRGEYKERVLFVVFGRHKFDWERHVVCAVNPSAERGRTYKMMEFVKSEWIWKKNTKQKQPNPDTQWV